MKERSKKGTGSTIDIERITLKRSRITSFKTSAGTVKGKTAASGSEW